MKTRTAKIGECCESEYDTTGWEWYADFTECDRCGETNEAIAYVEFYLSFADAINAKLDQ